jgi:hypothetical protein
MPFDDKAPRALCSGPCRFHAGAAAALALPVAFATGAGPEALAAAAALGALAGLFERLSRRKKSEEAAPAVKAAERAGEGPEDGPEAHAGKAPPAGKLPGKLPGKKIHPEAPPKPRPRRSDYTGQRVGVHVPGRKAEAAPAAPAGPGPAERPDGAAADACPQCRKPSGGPGQLCEECEAARFVTEVGNLVSSLKTREVNMLPAERHLFQARSALAVSAWKDVARLAAQAETAAREQEADFEESQRLLSRCEETIAAAIETGKNTLAAEKAFRKATLLFKDGKYTASMEEAVLIPALIMDRPRPRVVPAGGAPPAGAGPSGPDRAAPRAQAPEAGAVRCRTCGERIERGLDVCPACGGPAAPAGRPEWPAGASCTACGEALEPSWKVCPACNRPVRNEPAVAGGNCPSCGREVLPSWTMCPFCDARLRDPGEAVKVRKGFSRPEQPQAVIPPALREKGVLAQIEEVDRLLDEAARRGLDARKARNLLELALDFTRNGNYDKGERYVRKAKNVAETLLTLELYLTRP